MVRSCVVGGCSNSTTTKPTRHVFMKFYKSPDLSANNQNLRKTWDKRINRLPNHVKTRKTYDVCSEHFAPEQFDPSDYRIALESYNNPKMWVRLKTDAVPNTDPTDGTYQLYAGGQFNKNPTPRRNPAKRMRTCIYLIKF